MLQLSLCCTLNFRSTVVRLRKEGENETGATIQVSRVDTQQKRHITKRTNHLNEIKETWGVRSYHNRNV